ncbi:MAG: hypothetical protein WC635_13970 [Bacteriovorax sp.]
MRDIKKDQKGQTVIEYLLMLLVMVSIITSILTRIKTKYLGDPTKCTSAANKKTLLCKINGIIEPNTEGKKFQRWRIK